MRKTNDSPRHQNLKPYYLVALLLIALLVMASYGVLRRITITQEAAASVINVSGRQRMNSQRIALLAVLLESATDTSQRDMIRSELRAQISEMYTNHVSLTANSLDPSTSTQVHALYFDPPLTVDTQVKNFLSIATQITQLADSQLSASDPAVAELVAQAPVILSALDTVVIQYETDKNDGIRMLELVELAVVVVTLLLLLGETFFIFRPMEHQIRLRETALQREIEEREKTQVALRRSEAIYHLVVSNMPSTAVLMYDHDLRFTLADGPFLATAGYDKKRMEGKKLQEVVPASSYEPLLPLYQAALRGESVTIERDRGDVCYYAEFVPVVDEHNRIVGGMVVTIDITSRKRAEDALRASETRFRELAAHAPIGIFQIDTNDRYVFVNSRWRQITGLSTENSALERFGSLIYPDDLEAALKMWTTKDQLNHELTTELRLLKPDGQVIWVDGNLIPIRDLENEITGYIGTLMDVTQRKKSEEELQESRDFISNITATTPDLIYVYDIPEKRNVYMNHDLREFLGYSSETLDAIGESALPNLMHPDDLKNIVIPYMRKISAGEPHNDIQYRMQNGQNEWRWFNSYDRVLKVASDGSPLQILILCHDITDGKVAERQAIELELERKSVNVLSDFIRNTSHELRTPLTVISSSAYLLSRLNEPDKKQGKLEVINLEIEHLTQLIEDFQTMATLDSTSKLRLERINLTDLLVQVADQIEPQIEQKHLHFSNTVDGDLPIIDGDSQQLKTAIKHLLDNAIRFTPAEGQISIQATLGKDEEGHNVLIKITDTGIGIAAHDLVNIFKPLYKASEARTRDGSGSGVGLPIVQKIVDLHHGAISVESMLGEGTTFTLSLPLSMDYIGFEAKTS